MKKCYVCESEMTLLEAIDTLQNLDDDDFETVVGEYGLIYLRDEDEDKFINDGETADLHLVDNVIVCRECIRKAVKRNK